MFQRLRQLLVNSRFGPAEVTAVQQLTPHMIRLTLASDLVREFAPDCAGGHLKLVVPDKDQSPSAFEAFIEAGKFKSQMRTYTIRHARPHAGEIDVDIVTHGDLGQVGPWAQRTSVGEVLVISRCGSPKLITTGVRQVLAAADLTGFPALAAGLETLSGDVAVTAFVEIPSEEDRQPFDAAPGIAVRWIIKPDPSAPGTDLIEAIKSAPAPGPKTSVFVAGEFSTVKALRQYFKKELKVDKAHTYISSYWKVGLDENAHKEVKAAAA
ncbi:MAG: siderophore-interacting protein [Pseudomonadota bacterium]